MQEEKHALKIADDNFWAALNQKYYAKVHAIT